MYKHSSIFICIVILSTCLLQSQKWYESKVIILEASSDVLANSAMLEYTSLERTNDIDALVLEGIAETKLLVTTLFSGVINGYQFEYTPSDKISNTQEYWNLTLLHKLDTSDENIVLVNQEIYEGVLSVIYRYNLTDYQVSWLKSWEVSDIVSSKGEGVVYSDSFITSTTKIQALEEAIKVAIRNQLIQTIPNKPLRVKGIVRIVNQPFFIRSGEYYTAKVKVAIQVKDIEEHTFF